MEAMGKILQDSVLHLAKEPLLKTWNKYPYECPDCKETFEQKDIVIHILFHIRTEVQHCKSCINGFHEEPMLIEHLGTHVKDIVYQITNISEIVCSYARTRSLRSMSNEKSLLFKCVLCHAHFSVREDLAEHMVTHRTSFSNNSPIVRPKISLQPTMKRPTWCPRPTVQTFQNASNKMPTGQQQNHSIERVDLTKDDAEQPTNHPFKCQICNQNFVSVAACNRHELYHHKLYNYQNEPRPTVQTQCIDVLQHNCASPPDQEATASKFTNSDKQNNEGYTCLFCERIYLTLAACKRHEATHKELQEKLSQKEKHSPEQDTQSQSRKRPSDGQELPPKQFKVQRQDDASYTGPLPSFPSKLEGLAQMAQEGQPLAVISTVTSLSQNISTDDNSLESIALSDRPNTPAQEILGTINQPVANDNNQDVCEFIDLTDDISPTETMESPSPTKQRLSGDSNNNNNKRLSIADEEESDDNAVIDLTDEMPQEIIRSRKQLPIADEESLNQNDSMSSNGDVPLVFGVPQNKSSKPTQHVSLYDENDKPSGIDVELRTCKVCKKVLSNLRNLKQHMRIHSDERPFECNVCGKRFRQIHHMRDHYISLHTSERPFICNLCDKGFVRNNSLMKHMSSIHKDALYICTECGYRFKGENELAEHMHVHQENVIYNCSLCVMKLKSKWHLNHHKIRYHQVGQQTNDLNQPSTDNLSQIEKQSLLREQPTQPSQPMEAVSLTFECHMCCMLFPTESQLSIHMKMHKGDEIYECHVCGEEFSMEDQLFTHIEAHYTDGPTQHQSEQSVTVNIDQNGSSHGLLQAPVPELDQMAQVQMIGSSGVMNQIPVAVRHFTAGPSPANPVSPTLTEGSSKKTSYECVICGKCYKKEYNLLQHVKTHSGNGLFSCSICNKEFPTSRALGNHRANVHNYPEQGRRFKCDDCGKAFTSSYKLKEHELSHSGIRPYVCRICANSFCTRRAMTKHMLKHNIGLLYQCSQCGQGFGTEGLLKKHLHSHADEYRFAFEGRVCGSCGRGYMSAHDLARHIKASHNHKAASHDCAICGMMCSTFPELTQHMNEHLQELA